MFLLSIGILLSLSGCATMYGSTEHKVTIQTVPSGANIYVGHVLYGKTPGSVLLPAVGYSSTELTLKKPGYEDGHFLVGTKFQAVGYWNILCPIGFLIDMGAGTVYKLDPKDTDTLIYLKPAIESSSHAKI